MFLQLHLFDLRVDSAFEVGLADVLDALLALNPVRIKRTFLHQPLLTLILSRLYDQQAFLIAACFYRRKHDPFGSVPVLNDGLFYSVQVEHVRRRLSCLVPGHCPIEGLARVFAPLLNNLRVVCCLLLRTLHQIYQMRHIAFRELFLIQFLFLRFYA